MSFDHLQPGAPRHETERVRVDAFRVQQGYEPILDDRRRYEEGQHDHHRRRQDHPPLPKPRQIEHRDSRADPNGARLGEKHRHCHQDTAAYPNPKPLARTRREEQKRDEHRQCKHLLR